MNLARLENVRGAIARVLDIMSREEWLYWSPAQREEIRDLLCDLRMEEVRVMDYVVAPCMGLLLDG